jgi:hypothetical protein
MQAKPKDGIGTVVGDRVSDASKQSNDGKGLKSDKESSAVLKQPVDFVGCESEGVLGGRVERNDMHFWRDEQEGPGGRIVCFRSEADRGEGMRLGVSNGGVSGWVDGREWSDSLGREEDGINQPDGRRGTVGKETAEALVVGEEKERVVAKESAKETVTKTSCVVKKKKDTIVPLKQSDKTDQTRFGMIRQSEIKSKVFTSALKKSTTDVRTTGVERKSVVTSELGQSKSPIVKDSGSRSGMRTPLRQNGKDELEGQSKQTESRGFADKQNTRRTTGQLDTSGPKGNKSPMKSTGSVQRKGSVVGGSEVVVRRTEEGQTNTDADKQMAVGKSDQVSSSVRNNNSGRLSECISMRNGQQTPKRSDVTVGMVGTGVSLNDERNSFMCLSNAFEPEVNRHSMGSQVQFQKSVSLIETGRRWSANGQLFVPLDSRVVENSGGGGVKERVEEDRVSVGKSVVLSHSNSPFRPFQFSPSCVFHLLKMDSSCLVREDHVRQFLFEQNGFDRLVSYMKDRLSCSVELGLGLEEVMRGMEECCIEVVGVVGTELVLVDLLVDSRMVRREDRGAVSEYFRDHDQGLYVLPVEGQADKPVMVMVLLLSEADLAEDADQNRHLSKALKAMSMLCKSHLVAIRKTELESVSVDPQNPSQTAPRPPPRQPFQLHFSDPQPATISAVNPVLIGCGKSVAFYTKKTIQPKKGIEMQAVVYKDADSFDRFRKNFNVRLKDFSSLNMEFVEQFLSDKHRSAYLELKRELQIETEKAMAGEEKKDPFRFERHINSIMDITILKLMHQSARRELAAVRHRMVTRNPGLEEYLAQLDKGQLEVTNPELKLFFTHLEECFSRFYKEEEKQAIRVLGANIGIRADSLEQVFGVPKRHCCEELLKAVKKRGYKLAHMEGGKGGNRVLTWEDIARELEHLQAVGQGDQSEEFYRRQGEQVVLFLTENAKALLEKFRVLEKTKRDFQDNIERYIKRKMMHKVMQRLLETPPQTRRVVIVAIRVSKVMTSAAIPEWEFVYERVDDFDWVKEYRVFGVERDLSGEEGGPGKEEGEGLVAKRLLKFSLAEDESLAHMTSLPDHHFALAVNLFKGSEVRVVSKTNSLVDKLAFKWSLLLVDFNERSGRLVVVLESGQGLGCCWCQVTSECGLVLGNQVWLLGERVNRVEPVRVIQGLGSDCYVWDTKRELYRVDQNSKSVSKLHWGPQKVKGVSYWPERNCLVVVSDNKVVPVQLETGRAMMESKWSYESQLREAAIGEVGNKTFAFMVVKSKVHFSRVGTVVSKRKRLHFIKPKHRQVDKSISTVEFKSIGLLDHLTDLVCNPIRVQTTQSGGESHRKERLIVYVSDSANGSDAFERVLRTRLANVEGRFEDKVVANDTGRLSKASISYYGHVDGAVVADAVEAVSASALLRRLLCLKKVKLAKSDGDRLRLAAHTGQLANDDKPGTAESARAVELGHLRTVLGRQDGTQLKVLSVVDCSEQQSDDLMEELLGPSFESFGDSSADGQPVMLASVRLTPDCNYLLLDFRSLSPKASVSNLLWSFVNSAVSQLTIFPFSTKQNECPEGALDTFSLGAVLAKETHEEWLELVALAVQRRGGGSAEVSALIADRSVALKVGWEQKHFEEHLLTKGLLLFGVSETEEGGIEWERISQLTEAVKGRAACTQSAEGLLDELSQALAQAVNEDFADLGEYEFEFKLGVLKQNFDYFVRKGCVVPLPANSRNSISITPTRLSVSKTPIGPSGQALPFDCPQTDPKFDRFDVDLSGTVYRVEDKDVVLGENFKGLNDMFDKVYVKGRQNLDGWQEAYKTFVERAVGNRLGKTADWVERTLDSVLTDNPSVLARSKVEKQQMLLKLDRARHRYHFESVDHSIEPPLKINYRFVLNSKPCHFVLCLDDSGSMRGKPWDDLQQAVLGFVESRENSERERLTIVQFNDEPVVMCESIGVADFDLEQHLRFRSGGTNFGKAISKCHKLFTKNLADTHRPILIFMSDGRSESGEAEMRRLAEELVPKQLVAVVIMFNSQAVLPPRRKSVVRSSLAQSQKQGAEGGLTEEEQKVEEQLTRLALIAKGEYLNSKSGTQLKTHFKLISSALDGESRVKGAFKGGK